MFAIRARRKTVTEKDFLDAVNKVIKGYQKFSATPKYMVYNWVAHICASFRNWWVVSFLASFLQTNPLRWWGQCSLMLMLCPCGTNFMYYLCLRFVVVLQFWKLLHGFHFILKFLVPHCFWDRDMFLLVCIFFYVSSPCYHLFVAVAFQRGNSRENGHFELWWGKNKSSNQMQWKVETEIGYWNSTASVIWHPKNDGINCFCYSVKWNVKHPTREIIESEMFC